MQLDSEQKATIMSYAKGALGGMLLLAVAGQYYPGYMLDSSAQKEVQSARQAAVNETVSMVCADMYKSAPGGEAKLVALRTITSSYSRSSDVDVTAASARAIKLFSDGKISPLPESYGVNSGCSEQLFKSKPATAAQLK